MSVVERRLELRGRRVVYREGGQGPVLVFVHGLGLSGRFYDRNYPALIGAGLRVVAPDLPGFGGSSPTGRGLDVPGLAEWLLEFADALDLPRPAWLGHSIGAQPAMHLAADRPERAAALVLASPTGAPGPRRKLRQAINLARDAVAEMAALPAVARDYARVWPQRYVGLWLRAAGDHPLSYAGRIRCPTLVLRGGNDPVVPAAFVAALCQKIAGARAETLPGGVHSLVRDARDFNRAVVEFLRVALPL